MEVLCEAHQIIHDGEGVVASFVPLSIVDLIDKDLDCPTLPTVKLTLEYMASLKP